jgi:hypothetical protein
MIGVGATHASRVLLIDGIVKNGRASDRGQIRSGSLAALLVPSATIQYALHARSFVSLTVFNTLGQQVALPAFGIWATTGMQKRSRNASAVQLFMQTPEEVGGKNRIILITWL